MAAAAILAVIAAIVFGSLNNLMASQTRMQEKLACAEIANRLILQYLDDKESLPSPALELPYAGNTYRWSLAQSAVTLSPARPDVAAERAGASSLTIDRLQHVVVRVWLSEESGGSHTYDESVPHATLTRLLDPIAAINRNPDSSQYLVSDVNSERFRSFMADFSKYGTGGRRNPSGPKPAPSRPGAAPSTPSTPSKGSAPSKGGKS